MADVDTVISPADYFKMDVSHLPLGMRISNNPGNLKYTGSTWQRSNLFGIRGPSTARDQGDSQILFANPLAGMASAVRLAQLKYGQGMRTVNDIIAGPAGWTPGYRGAAENIARLMGVRPDVAIDLSNPDTMKTFMRALITQEHGEAGKLYSDDLIAQAIPIAFAGRSAMPASGAMPLGGPAPAAPASSPAANSAPTGGASMTPASTYDGLSPEDVAYRRRMAQMLMQQGTDASPVGHWTQALARALQGGISGLHADAAREGERDGRASLARLLASGADPAAVAGNPWGAELGGRMLQAKYTHTLGAPDREADRALRAREVAVSEDSSRRQQTMSDWQIAQIINQLRKPDATASIFSAMGFPVPERPTPVMPTVPAWAHGSPTVVSTSGTPGSPAAGAGPSGGSSFAPMPTGPTPAPATPSSPFSGASPAFSPGTSTGVPGTFASPGSGPGPSGPAPGAPAGPSGSGIGGPFAGLSAVSLPSGPSPTPLSGAAATPSASRPPLNPWSTDPRKAALAFGMASGRIPDKAGSMIARGPEWMAVPETVQAKSWEASQAAYEAANTHASTVAAIDQMIKLAPSAFVGSGADARAGAAALLSSLNVNGNWLITNQSLSATQLLQQGLSQFIGTEAAKYKPISNSDISFIARTLPNVGQDRTALMNALEAAKKIALRQQLYETGKAELLQTPPRPDLAGLMRRVREAVPDHVFDPTLGKAPGPSGASSGGTAAAGPTLPKGRYRVEGGKLLDGSGREITADEPPATPGSSAWWKTQPAALSLGGR
jgi:hypothetical protein